MFCLVVLVRIQHLMLSQFFFLHDHNMLQHHELHFPIVYVLFCFVFNSKTIIKRYVTNHFYANLILFFYICSCFFLFKFYKTSITFPTGSNVKIYVYIWITIVNVCCCCVVSICEWSVAIGIGVVI